MGFFSEAFRYPPHPSRGYSGTTAPTQEWQSKIIEDLREAKRDESYLYESSSSSKPGASAFSYISALSTRAIRRVYDLATNHLSTGILSKADSVAEYLAGFEMDTVLTSVGIGGGLMATRLIMSSIPGTLVSVGMLGAIGYGIKLWNDKPPSEPAEYGAGHTNHPPTFPSPPGFL